MGEGFQSNMNFSFSMREKMAAESDEGPVGTIKIAMSLSQWMKAFPKLGFSGSSVVEMNEIPSQGVITSKEEAWAR